MPTATAHDRPPIIFAFSNDRDFDTSPVDDFCAVRFTHYTHNFLVHGPPLRSESGVLWVRTGGAAWVGGGTEHTWGRGKPQWQPFPLVHLAARVWWLCSPPTWRLSADAQWVVPNSDANSKRLYGKSGPQLALVLTATTSHHQAATTSTQA